MPRKSRNNGKVATSNKLPARVIQSNADRRTQIPARYKKMCGGGHNVNWGYYLQLLQTLPEEDGTICIYDKIREIEEREKLPFESLIKFVRKLHEAQGTMRWEKEPISTQSGNGSFHCWLEDKDGMIIDPHFKEYDDMMKMPRCNGRAKVYEEWSPKQQKEKLKNLIPEVMENIEENATRNNIPKEAVMAIIAANPGFRACPLNAWCMKSIRPELRFVIGNMGFRSRDDPNKVWWEY